MTRQPKNQLYILTGVICFLGGLWLVAARHFGLHASVCPVKLISGYPCPSCGSTRSIHLLLEGRFVDAVLLNPLGLVSFSLFITVVLVLLMDTVMKSDIYYQAYQYVGKVLRDRRIFSTLLIVLVIANWIWNIYKRI